jgi:hypothetical protein
MPASAEPASRRDWQEIFALLDTALDLDSDQRAAWLEHCRPNTRGYRRC